MTSPSDTDSRVTPARCFHCHRFHSIGRRWASVRSEIILPSPKFTVTPAQVSPTPSPRGTARRRFECSPRPERAHAVGRWRALRSHSPGSGQPPSPTTWHFVEAGSSVLVRAGQLACLAPRTSSASDALPAADSDEGLERPSQSDRRNSVRAVGAPSWYKQSVSAQSAKGRAAAAAPAQRARRPRVSVFSPSHQTRYLDDCIRSLLTQTYEDWEWIVVLNQGARWRPPVEDPRLRLVIKDDLIGVGAAKRHACSLAIGEFLVELDHDDELRSDALELIVEAFDAHPEVGFVFSNFAQINEDGA